MHIIRGRPGLAKFSQATVATIGNFDGVHLGHQAVLHRLTQQAANLGLPSVVILFEPQPMEFFLADQAPARLTRLAEKLEGLRCAGVDYVCCLRFNQGFSLQSAADFIHHILLEGLRVKHLIVGDDFRFGHQRQGNFALLQAAGRQFGFAVEGTPTYYDGETRVSSTRVRQALVAGDFNLAQRLLGRPYAMVGRVIHGDKRGRSIGYPTLNIPVRRQRCPLHGVYAVQVQANGTGPWWNGVANLGKRPTVGGSGMLLEVHLFDCNGDWYAQRVQVRFCSKLREEQKFVDFVALKVQIDADAKAARLFFAG